VSWTEAWQTVLGVAAGGLIVAVGSALAIWNSHLAGKRRLAERELELRERELMRRDTQ